ncbi:hypothetical protein DPMN_150704 [Dreissena polymorpha]|nr:hypothetical protein DPMN_150704 [Dreissena polymorpha]
MPATKRHQREVLLRPETPEDVPPDVYDTGETHPPHDAQRAQVCYRRNGLVRCSQ